MSDKDRLRRLDALFAERVMGHGLGSDLGGNMRWYNSKQEPLEDLPPYTQSLDAVWEATHEKFCCRTLFSDYNYFHRVKVCLEDGTLDHQDITAEADHPAEALVLACLRAVGCSEEEMK